MKYQDLAPSNCMKDQDLAPGSCMTLVCKTKIRPSTYQGKKMIWPIAGNDYKTMIWPIAFTFLCMVCGILGNSLSFMFKVSVYVSGTSGSKGKTSG